MESAAPQEITRAKPTTPTINMASATGTRNTSSTSRPIKPMPPINSLLMRDTAPSGGEKSPQHSVQQATQSQECTQHSTELVDRRHGNPQVLGHLTALGGYTGLLPQPDRHHCPQHYEAKQKDATQARLEYRRQSMTESFHHYLAALYVRRHGC